jgi:hypothetical protein
MERKLIENTEFEKVEITRTLFNRCTLIELLIVEQMQISGELRKKAFEHQRNEQSEHTDEPIEQPVNIERTSQNTGRFSRLRY